MIFCDREDCMYNEDGVCECCEDMWIGENGCQTYSKINPEDYEEEGELPEEEGDRQKTEWECEA